MDGLPQQAIYADRWTAPGNRWFGGDGLSRLDSSEQWTHYNRANSGLAKTQLTPLPSALTARSGWATGVDDETISWRNPDGSWQSYVSRMAAVSRCSRRSGRRRMSTACGRSSARRFGRDYQVYDGVQWLNRACLPATAAPVTVVANGNTGITGSAMADKDIFQWIC
ncbi:MAG: hypothetical protein R2932_20395 [Caldilineaceae bacterium]